MALDNIADALAIATEMESFHTGGNDASMVMIPVIESILDAGFQNATPSLGNVDISPPAGSFKILGLPTIPLDIAIGEACALYWSAAIGPGSPESCSTVSVSNDAAKIAAPIAANIKNLAGNGYLTPYYADFVDAIHKEVKTIVWTVDESGPTCSASFAVTVS